MKYRFYTGPCIVHQVAEQMRQNGLDVFLEGTEHVYFRTDAPLETIKSQLPAWVNLHDIQSLPNNI